MAISDKLQELLDIKQDIKEAIENKDVDLTDVAFSGYAEKIHEIPAVVELTQAQYDALSQGKPWVLNESLNTPINNFTLNINFTSNNENFTQISITEGWGLLLNYGNQPVFSFVTGRWLDENYRIITFETAPVGDLLYWLETNAVKQIDDVYDNNTYYLIVEE